MICIPYSVLVGMAFLAIVGTVTWRAPLILEWVLGFVATEVTPGKWEQIMAFSKQEGAVTHMEDPERIEMRLRGALHEISPETRQAWVAEEKRLRRRTRILRGVMIGVTLSMWGLVAWALWRQHR